MSNVHLTVGEEEEEAENHFHCLPDDVVLNIFNNLSDVKRLCRCFVVCKRFSSLIPLVKTVSVETDTWNSVLGSEERDFLFKFSQFITNNFKLAPPLLPSPPLNFPDLVFHLKHIQSLTIELPSHFDADSDAVVKRGASFAPTLKIFTFLYAASLSKSDDGKDHEESEDITFDCLKDAMLWLATLSCAVPTYSMLESISITDWKNKEVRLCLGGEKLVEYRNTLEISPTIPSRIPGAWTLEISPPILSESPGGWTLGNMMVGYVPVLQLPVSGYVMTEANIFIFNFNIFAFDDTALLDAFAVEKCVFSEAVAQILEKHKGTISTLF